MAILLWALLALFTSFSAPIPPFQLTALSFGIGTTVGILWAIKSGTITRIFNVRPAPLILGTLGLFGYHALYFAALRLAPEAEAGLIAYLWPLLIVLMSGLLPDEKLRFLHVFGAVISFAGTALLLSGKGLAFESGNVWGYIFAFLCAFTWSSYSVLARKWSDTPTESVILFCALTALLSTGAHFAFEDTVIPTKTVPWLAVIGLGIGPVGAAFYTWDIGVKHGDFQLLGVLSYAAPLLSTLVLLATGIAKPTIAILGAAVLITLGAGIAALGSKSQKN